MRRMNSIKLLCAVYLLALAALPVHVLSRSTFDWKAFEHAVLAYQAKPSTATADAIKALLPSEHVSYDHSPPEKSALRALEQLLPTLFNSIRNREPEAVALGFDLLLVADGGMLEDIYAPLSELITSDPALFLEELQSRNHVPPQLVSFMGQRFVDQDPKLRCYELQGRHRAVSGITDAGLTDIRDRCLDTLASRIATRCPTRR